MASFVSISPFCPIEWIEGSRTLGASPFLLFLLHLVPPSCTDDGESNIVHGICRRHVRGCRQGELREMDLYQKLLSLLH